MKKTKFFNLAQKLAETFQLKTTNNLKPYYITISQNKKFIQFIQDLYQQSPHDNFIFKTIYQSLLHFSDYFNIQTAKDSIFELDPLSDILELTKWLYSNTNRITYLTMVIKNKQILDGTELLQQAQLIEIQHIYNNVLNFLIVQTN